MTDRFDDMALDVHREMEAEDTWPDTYAVLAAALRAQHRAGQEAARKALVAECERLERGPYRATSAPIYEQLSKLAIEDTTP